MSATIYSFSYKMGGRDQFATTGPNAPMIFDCRGINNPHQDRKLRRLTGRDEAVKSAVWRHRDAKIMVRRAVAHLRTNPNGTVAFGCSYGVHRSVACAEMTADYIPGAVVIHTGAIAHRRNA